GVPVDAPQFVAETAPGQLGQKGPVKHFRKADQNRCESPECGLALFVVEEDRQPGHCPHTTLYQVEWSGEGELAGVTGEPGLCGTCRIAEHVMSDGAFIAGKRYDGLDHTLGRQPKRRHLRVELQHLARYGVEIGDCAVSLANQGGQGVSSGESPVKTALKIVRMVSGKI